MKVSENSFWVEVNEDEFASEELFDELSQQFTSDPHRIQRDVSNKQVEKFNTVKKSKELKVLDTKTAQNLSMY